MVQKLRSTPAGRKTLASRQKTKPATLTVSLPQFLVEGSDLQFREFIADFFAAVAGMQSLRRALAKSVDLSAAEFSILLATWHLQKKGRVGITAVSKNLHVAAAHVTAEVGKLVRADLIKKTQHTADTRAVTLVLTKKGEAVLNELAPLLRRINDRLFSGNTQNAIAVVARFLKHVADEFDEFSPAGEEFLAMSSQTCLETTERCLANIHDAHGEGARAFTRVYDDAARAAAEFADRTRQNNVELPPLTGVTVSIKDLFDVRGEPTLAGSRALRDAPPAQRDAEIVRRLRQAGAVIVGKTNMTEFAFSGLGINPHYGTPANPWRREERRIPGGSSSGAGVSVSDGMAQAAIGTDTGGSVRIPAALCGLVGFKATARTVPTQGTLPLSQSFDSIGPLARDVATCARVYGVLSGSASPNFVPDTARPPRLTLAVPQNYVLENMDAAVAKNYESALHRLAAAGVTLKEVKSATLERLPALFEQGGIVAAEAYAWHEGLMNTAGPLYDPRVIVRIKRGSQLTAALYLKLLAMRNELIAQWSQEIGAFNAIVMPTVPIVAPRIADLEDDDAYSKANLLMLRNPTVINALDGCAITLPCHPGEAPTGLMLAACGGRDNALLEIAASLENIVNGAR